MWESERERERCVCVFVCVCSYYFMRYVFIFYFIWKRARAYVSERASDGTHKFFMLISTTSRNFLLFSIFTPASNLYKYIYVYILCFLHARSFSITLFAHSKQYAHSFLNAFCILKFNILTHRCVCWNQLNIWIARPPFLIELISKVILSLLQFWIK